jgi:hypothetical protein
MTKLLAAAFLSALFAGLLTAFYYADDVARLRTENDALRARIHACTNLPADCGLSIVCG